MPNYVSKSGAWEEVKNPNIKEKKENELDLNKDGKVDKKDASIAGKVLSETKKIKKAKVKVEVKKENNVKKEDK